MIAYDLKCVNDHCFEGWFEDDQTYREQEKKGLIACPVCNETSVVRIPSTFAIKHSLKSSSASPPPDSEMAEFGRRIANYVEKNFDNVGCEFAKEALKIHYGVVAPRNIRGTSTPAEEKTLKEEGIEFLKIPIPSTPEPDA